MATTTLANLLNRMSRYQPLAVTEEIYKVMDLDEAIRTVKRTHNLPFLMKKGTLRVFPEVFLYPTAVDHDYLVYMDTQDPTVPYGSRMRARYTSLQQFYEDLDYRNVTAEIWSNNTLMIGVRDKDVPPGFLSNSQLLDNASSISNYTASGDASGLVLDTVNFVDYANADSSIRFTNTPSSNAALVSWTLDSSFTDTNYQRKYFFVYVYLTGVPTSATLRFGVDGSNYLSATVTSQFSGQAFIANDWNFLAIDLNTAATTGTVTTSSVFDYAAVQLNSAPVGTYNICTSYLKGWTLLDYWYYSKYIVQEDGETSANKECFLDADGTTYSLDDSLIGDYEWADVVMYEAMIRGLMDKENELVLGQVTQLRDAAMKQLGVIYPDQKPLVITQSYRYMTDYSADNWSL